MSDLISRQDIKYHTQLEAMGNGQYEEVEVAYKNDIESLPSADAVEVVRCKDCKWRGHWGCALRIVNDGDKPKDDDFCSFGEREEERAMTREEAIRKLKRELEAIEGDWLFKEFAEALDMAIEALSADRPKNMIHIDEVYRLIAGHSNYHGDSILSAFTCLVEGKDVKPIAPLDESADIEEDVARQIATIIENEQDMRVILKNAEPKTGKWVFDEDGYFRCEVCGKKPNDQSATTDYCPKCGARLGGDTE